MILDPWQERVLQAAMGERSDGSWAARRVGLSVPRQNGKSELILARALAGAILFEERLIIISAHQQDTARQIFNRFLELRELSPALAKRVTKVMEAFNREFIKFSTGSEIQFKARSGPGGRGFSADCLLLDEAQILDMRRWVSINSTMSARANPQIWLTGTPPTPEDNGEVFESVRAAAKAGKSGTLAWLEWGATIDDDPGAPETLSKANPAWHSRINHEVVQGEFETYPPERFALDRLGIWQDDLGGSAIFPGWKALASAEPWSPTKLAVAGDIDGTVLTLGASDGTTVGLVAPAEFSDLVKVPRHREREFVIAVARISAEQGCPVALQERGPAWALREPLEEAGVQVIPVSFEEFVEACSDFDIAARADELRHSDDPDLNADTTRATWRTVSDRRVISRKTGDISGLEAVILARHGASNALVPLATY